MREERLPYKMLHGAEIVCLADIEWSGYWTVAQPIMSRLARQNTVLYVEPDRSFLYPLRALQDKAGLRRYIERWQGLTRQGENLYVYSPPPVFTPFFTYAGSRLMRRCNAALMSFLVQQQMQRLGLVRPILWCYLAWAYELMDRIDATLVVYDCIDEWSALFGHGRLRQAVQEMDRLSCQTADLVFAGSLALLESKTAFNPHTYYVPHAADVENFAQAALAETPVPADIARLKKPILGFIGILDGGRFDLQLVDMLARTLPECSLVIVGKALGDGFGLDLGRLTQRANVHLLGMKGREALPGYLKAFDVCLIPYLINDFTRSIYPLKLHEYMASGKPIVTTRIPACEEYRDVMRIAETPEEFLAHVMAALREDDVEMRRRRMQIAQENSWERRVQEKSRLIEEHLGRG